MMKVLSPLFELDPLFRRTFLFCVPPVAFGKIATSGLFPQVEVCMTLARGLSLKDYVMPDEVNSFLAFCFVSFHFFFTKQKVQVKLKFQLQPPRENDQRTTTRDVMYDVSLS